MINSDIFVECVSQFCEGLKRDTWKTKVILMIDDICVEISYNHFKQTFESLDNFGFIGNGESCRSTLLLFDSVYLQLALKYHRHHHHCNRCIVFMNIVSKHRANYHWTTNVSLTEQTIYSYANWISLCYVSSGAALLDFFSFCFVW